MSVEEVFGIMGFTTALGVEIQATCFEATHAKDNEHDFGGEVDIGGELVRVPAEEGVTAIGVYGAKFASIGSHGELMAHGVARKGGVIGLYIELKIIEKIVFAEEVQAGSGVGVILVGAWLTGLRLDVEGTLEADFLGVIHGHVKQAGEIIELALHVGIKKGGIAFAATPENIAETAELVGDFERLLYLSGSVGIDMGIGRSACTLGVTRV